MTLCYQEPSYCVEERALRSNELVTNLPPESKEKWAKYSEARTVEEKLAALREFYSSIPKHKGTSKLRANIKRQISNLRHQMEEKKTRARRGGRGWFIEKQGAAQIVLLGLANSGKSTLLSKITNARPVVSSFPFATMKPEVGIYNHGEVPFQLIDTPSLQAVRDVGSNPQILGLARNADGLIIVLDLSVDPVEQFNVICEELDESGIIIMDSSTRIEFIRSSDDTQVKVSGKLLDCTKEDVRRLLNSYRIRSGLVKIGGYATLDQIEDLIFKNTVYRPAVIVANKMDVQRSSSDFNRLLESVSGGLRVLPFSCFKDGSFNQLGETLFSVLGIIRVYTKNPNRSSRASAPITVRKDTTVIEIARIIHSRLSRNFRYARVWGRSVKHDGQHVGQNHVLVDGDIVEVHCR